MLAALPAFVLFAAEGAAGGGVTFDAGSMLTGTGFAALTWYLVSKAIPKLQDSFVAALDKERQTFADLMADEREVFAAELRAERESKHKIADEFNKTILRLASVHPVILSPAQVVAAGDNGAPAARQGKPTP